MSTVNVEKSKVFDVTPAKAWALIEDWNWSKWLIPGPPPEGNSPAEVKDCEYPARTISMLDGSGSWTEKCTILDKDAMRCEYIVTSPLPPPFDAIKIETFKCYLSVEAADGGAKITVGADYEDAEGIPPFFTQGLMYEAWIESIGAAAAK